MGRIIGLIDRAFFAKAFTSVKHSRSELKLTPDDITCEVSAGIRFKRLGILRIKKIEHAGQKLLTQTQPHPFLQE